MQHPAFRWLGPRPSVLLWEAQKAEGLWEPLQGAVVRRSGDAGEKPRTSFTAIALPEDMLLRKQLLLPKLDARQLMSAIELQATISSPFPQADLIWVSGAALPFGAEGKLQVELVLASRQRVMGYLAGQAGPLENPEVWVRSGPGLADALVLPGFGEERRLAAQRRGWVVLGGVALLGFILAGILAATPTLQLRARALQASAQLQQLSEKTRPLLAKREALLATNTQLEALSGITSNRLDPLATMRTLTNVLGDETMLQRLQIEGRNVLIVGQTPDTAAMMQKLSAQSGFQGVRAPSAATRPPGAPKEIFQVEFTIQDASAEVLPPAESDAASEAKP